MANKLQQALDLCNKNERQKLLFSQVVKYRKN